MSSEVRQGRANEDATEGMTDENVRLPGGDKQRPRHEPSDGGAIGREGGVAEQVRGEARVPQSGRQEQL